MCLLYIVAGFGILLTVISGQYSHHELLFWSFLSSLVATGFLYSLQRRVKAGYSGYRERTRFFVELGGGVSGFAAFGLFIWLMIVIWI